MSNWTNDELMVIGSSEELDIASLGEDGAIGKRTTIWVVRVGDGLYVRAYRGPTSVWYRATQVRHQGRIWAAGIERDVSFEDGDPSLNDQIDAAYRTKYRRHEAQYVDPMVADPARATTIKLVPRSKRA